MLAKVKVSLSGDLRKKYGVRTFSVVVGDIIKVKSGKRRGEGGKVIEVNHTNGMVSVEGVTVAKEDGKQTAFFLRPEDLVITRLDFSRDERIQKLREIAAIKKITFQEPAPEDLAPPPSEEEEPAEVESEAEEVKESDTLEPSEEEPADAEAVAEEPEDEEEVKSESEEKDDQ